MARVEMNMHEDIKIKLMEDAKKNKMSVSEYIRQLIIGNGNMHISCKASMIFAEGFVAGKKLFGDELSIPKMDASFNMLMVDMGINNIDFMPRSAALIGTDYYKEFDKRHGIK